MSMTNENPYAGLVRHDLIAEPQAKLETLLGRRKPAADAVTAAVSAHADATTAYTAALVSGDGHAARQAMEDAERRLATARDVPPALEAAIHRAEVTLRDVRNRAMAPAMGAAIQARLASAKRADAARAELAASKADHAAATAAIRRFGGAHSDLDGGSPSLTPHTGEWTQPTYAEDLRKFSGPHGYFPGLDEAGNVRAGG